MAAKTNKHVVTDSEVAAFNMFRKNIEGKEFSQSEMRDELKKKLNYSRAAAMLRALSDGVNAPIVKVRRGVYVANQKPVYKERLQTCWDTYTKYANPQDYKTGEHQHVCTIEQAIKRLKDAGYKVLKPVTQYEEV